LETMGYSGSFEDSVVLTAVFV